MTDKLPGLPPAVGSALDLIGNTPQLEVKNLDTGRVAFRVSGYSRQAPIATPVIRWGFRLFGRWTQERFYRNIQRRMYRLTQAAQRGRPLPAPTVRSDGLVLAPSGARPPPAERLARGWLHAGS